MSKNKHGDYFLMWWDGTAPCFQAVKGHLSEAEFSKVLKPELEDLAEEPRERYGKIRHLFARWGFLDTGGWGWEGGRPTVTLYLYEDQGRGEFPVTVVFRDERS